MSSEALISVRDLGKVYRIYNKPEDRLKQMVLSRWRSDYREFWALRHVDFDVHQGDTVGFLGRNGAGKSTLLQLICGTLTPSEGEVHIRGRISALLELGSGFNPEFTGQENVYLYGAVLGLDRSAIDGRLDRILTFADIGSFIDLPVKTYSSGMMVRLAFSVAINVDPRILVVDEALAVGDARFSARCMKQLRLMQDDGVSILFVGHDIDAIRRLCSRAFVLQDGRVVQQGVPRNVTEWYVALVAANYDLARVPDLSVEDPVDPVSATAEATSAPESGGASDDAAGISEGAPASSPVMNLDLTNECRPAEYQLFRYGDGNARILRCDVLDSRGRRSDHITLDERITIEITVEFLSDQAEHGIGFYIDDRLGTHVIGINTFQERIDLPQVRKGSRLNYRFSFPIHLQPGRYAISPSVAYSQEEPSWMDAVQNATVFTVTDPIPGRMVFGVCLPPHREVTVQTIG
jgi:lipopolysaccharide transport system ATP-binding protein